ncbi:hypothetical protein H6G91_26025 [Nostoc muscorum FACHB-395]|nr:hypothetical protein [Desmonostoc muscorum FACHB-395]
MTWRGYDYDGVHLILSWRNPRRRHLNLALPSQKLVRQTPSTILANSRTAEVVESISPGYRRTGRIHQGVQEDSGFSSATNSIVDEKTERKSVRYNAMLL